MTRSVAALDIGGANLKRHGPRAGAASRPFELWRRPGDLTAELAAFLGAEAPLATLAITMTGELCDAFETKAAGVRAILSAAYEAGYRLGEPEILVWRTDGRFAALDEAMADPLPAAAANWLALAVFAGRLAPEGGALLIDTGSTTTDIVPLEDGKPVPRARTDTERLLAGELVYTGARRTPLCAVAREAPYRGRPCPLAAEFFATALDVHVILGAIPEDPGARDTADGRPATRAWARDRLARMVGADRETFGEEDALAMAAAFATEQRRAIAAAAHRVAAGRAISRVILAGAGEFLARPAVEGLAPEAVSFAREFGPEVSAAAPAYALQQLAAEGLAGRR